MCVLSKLRNSILRAGSSDGSRMTLELTVMWTMNDARRSDVVHGLSVRTAGKERCRMKQSEHALGRYSEDVLRA